MLPFVVAGGGDPLSVVKRGPCPLELPGLGQCRTQAYVEPPESRIARLGSSAAARSSRFTAARSSPRSWAARPAVSRCPAARTCQAQSTAPRRAAVRGGSGRTVRGGNRGSLRAGGPVRGRPTRASRRSGGGARRGVTWGSRGKPPAGSGCGGSRTPPPGLYRASLCCTRPFAISVLEVAAKRVARLGREQLPDRLHAEVLTDDRRAGQNAAGPRPRDAAAARSSRAWIVGGSTGRISLPVCSLREAASCSR